MTSGLRLWTGLTRGRRSRRCRSAGSAHLVPAGNLGLLLSIGTPSVHTIEHVLLLQNVLSYYRMCSLTIECVLFLESGLLLTSWQVDMIFAFRV